MGFLPDFKRPSDPSVTVRLREATVSDSIDFSDVDEDREEQATTLFLNRLQDKATYTDSAKWTAEDRRFALFWYWLHTAKDLEVPMVYDCDHCGKKHTSLVNMSLIADEYTSITGKAERDILFDGVPLTVAPINGEGATEIESMRVHRDAAMEANGAKSGAVRKLESKLRMLSFLRTISVNGKTPDETEAWLLTLTTGDFSRLHGKVMEALAEMRHGLPSSVEDFRVVLVSPPIQCENKKEDKDATTRLSFPFRAFDYIPRI